MLMKLSTILTMMFLSMAAPSFGGGAVNIDQRQEGVRFQEKDWKIVRSIEAIDTNIIKALISHFKDDNRIANVNESFNATDVVNRMPTRRLVLAGYSGSRWFVLYEHGGRGLHLVLVVLDTKTQPPQMVLLARGEAGTRSFIRGWQVSKDDIGTALINGKLHIDNPSDPYY
jgi:hypothetical protein